MKTRKTANVKYSQEFLSSLLKGKERVIYKTTEDYTSVSWCDHQNKSNQ